MPPNGINDGTDPAKPTPYIFQSFERRNLPDGDRETGFFTDLSLPFGDGLNVFAMRLPIIGVESADNGFGLGDIGVKLSRVVPTDENGAVIIGGQLEFDTASADERGTGQTVASASLIIERVLPGGTIVAPTITHSLGISGSDSRVNFTRANLYLVLDFGIDTLYLTIDPAFTRDWGEASSYGDVTATVGYRFARLGNADVQAFIRPGVGVGKARSFDASIEVGLQLLNF